MPFLVSMGQESQRQSILCVGNYRKTVGVFLLNKNTTLDKDMDYIKRELGVVFQSSVLDSFFLFMIIWKAVPLYMALPEWNLRNGLWNLRRY